MSSTLLFLCEIVALLNWIEENPPLCYITSCFVAQVGFDLRPTYIPPRLESWAEFGEGFWRRFLEAIIIKFGFGPHDWRWSK